MERDPYLSGLQAMVDIIKIVVLVMDISIVSTLLESVGWFVTPRQKEGYCYHNGRGNF